MLFRCTKPTMTHGLWRCDPILRCDLKAPSHEIFRIRTRPGKHTVDVIFHRSCHYILIHNVQVLNV